MNLIELTNSTINWQYITDFDQDLNSSINWQYIIDFHKDLNRKILIMKHKYS